MNGSPMGTMTGWINTEADLRHEGRLAPARSASIFDRVFGRNHDLARKSDQTMRLLLAGGNA